MVVTVDLVLKKLFEDRMGKACISLFRKILLNHILRLYKGSLYTREPWGGNKAQIRQFGDVDVSFDAYALRRQDIYAMLSSSKEKNHFRKDDEYDGMDQVESD